MVSLCSACQDLLIDMHIDIRRSPFGLRERKLTTKYDLDLSGLTNHVSSVSRREKGVRIIALAFSFKTFFYKKSYVTILDHLGQL